MSTKAKAKQVVETESADELLVDEFERFLRDQQPDMVIRLLELNALRAEGTITESDFADQRANLCAD